ncbi:MAG: hypothetical protein ACLFTJ_13230, partial [Halothece sp.]
MKHSNKRKRIIIVADLGASNPKFIASFKRNKLDYLILDSRIQNVPASLVNKHREEEEWLIDERLPSEDAFLQLANEDDYWVFGPLSQYFEPEQRLDKNLKKYELGALRILCGLGLLAQQQGIKHRNFELDLCVLLPVNEIGDKEPFLNYFENMAKNWWFRGEAFSCTLRRKYVEREGASTLRYLLAKQQYKDKYKNQTLGLLMAGYRNLSLFVLKNGKAEVQESPIQGFHKCVENICRNNAAIKPAELNAALANAYYSLLPYELEEFPKEFYDIFKKVYLTLRKEPRHNFDNYLTQKEQTREGKLFRYHFFNYSNDSDNDPDDVIFNFKRTGKVPDFRNCEEIQKLIKTREPYNAKQELNNLINDIDKEINAYGDEFKFLLERYFKEIDQLIVIGGASIFLYSWITDFCNRYDLLKIDDKKLSFLPPYENSSYSYNPNRKVIEIDSLANLREELVESFGLDA